MSVEVVTVQPRARNSGLCCAKIVKHLGRHRNRVQPTRGSTTPGSEFFEVAPGRTLHVLRPELKSQRYYEALAVERPESIADNFYTRWARRPHPSDNCRCSFRQSTTGRLSSPEEALVSRIRTSLCEAERTGRDIDEIERSLGKVDLAKIDIPVESDVVKSETANSRIHPIDDSMKQRIVKDLDKYISELLDEILNDTIKAIAQSENPFGRREAKQQQPSLPDQPCSPTFNITFAFHSDEDKKDKEEKVSEEGKGYDNPGFVESLSDPETMDFHLRRRINGDRMMENADCTDSGINSVETVELQPEQEPNLEQSLMDIIDAKLGGSSIGKSLENLSMEIDAADNADVSTREQPTVEQVQMSSHEKSIAEDEPIDKKSPVTSDAGEASSNEQQAKAESTEPTESKPPVEAVEEPSFTARGLRLEFKQSNRSKESADESKPRPRAVSRFSKTLSLIRRRLVTRLNKRRRKRVSAPETSKSSRLSGGPCKPGQGRSSLRPIDLNRRRIPVPLRLITPELEDEAGVTLRRRGRKPTIVFLHGFGASADSFQPQLRYFADLGYPCVAPDMLGHGLSSAPNRGADYQFDRLLADLEAVLLKYAFRPGQKCVLVGHNYGCSFATALAQRYAANVHQLVLIAGGGPIPLAPPPGREGPGHCCLRSCLTPLLFCGVRRGVMYSARGRQHPYCGPEGIPWASTHLRHVLGGMSWPDGDHVFLRRICTPTLLVHGLRDDKVSLVQECQMERTMGKAVLEAIPTAGHMPMTDCPEQLNHMIHCFIDLWKNKKW